MIETPNIRDRELQTLKKLLLSDEHRELLALRSTVDELTRRVGSNEAMQESVRAILSQALEQVSQQEPAEISRTLAPLVMSSMKRQIKSSADDVIEIMYPLTGRMIAASVKSAINSLSERINREIESKFPLKTFLLKLRSRVFGLSASDLVLAASESAAIQRIMILEKATGHPIQIWAADDQEEDHIENPELVTGMLAALNNLAEEAFDAAAGSLRTLQLDGRQIALRSSATHLLILEISGKLKPADEARVDSFFADWIEGITTQENPVLPSAFEALAHRTGDPRSTDSATSNQNQPQHRSLTKPLFIIALVGAVLAWPAWNATQRWSLDADAERISQLIGKTHELSGFPLRVKPVYESQSLSVTGLLPAGIDLRKMRLAWLKATDYRQIETNVRFVVTAPLPAPQW